MAEKDKKAGLAVSSARALPGGEGRAGRPVLGRTLRIFTAPARLFSHHAERHYRRRYHGRYRFARRIFILDVVLLGLILSLAAFISAEFLARPRLAETIRVEMAVVPAAPRSGDRVTLAFSYENRSRALQKNVEIGLRLPPGFLPDQTDIPNFRADTRIFLAGDLPPGGRGSLELGGVLLAVPGAFFQAAAVTSAIDADSGTNLIRAASFSFPVGRSALAADLSVPQTLVADQETALALSYRNEGNAVIDEAVIVPLLPEGFIVAGSEPELAGGSWRVLKIAPGSSGKLTLRLRLPADYVPASADLGIRLGFRAEDQLIPQGEISRTVEVIAPKVKITSSADGAAVSPGKTLSVLIEAENGGSLVLRDAEFRLAFEPEWVDLDAARGARRDGRSLLITSAEVPGLAVFRPGDRLSAEVSLPLNSEIAPDPANAGRPFVLRQSLALEGEAEQHGRIRISADPVEYPVISSLGLRAAARYFTAEGEQIGRGPLPPVVGKKTRYWIFLEAKSAPNDARDAVIEGKLVRGVSWADFQSVAAPGARPVAYDPASRIVRWEIPKIPAAGEEPFGGAFAVDFLPVAEQVGVPAVLFEAVTIRGIDDPTGKEISATAPDVTTELAGDVWAEGKGSVVE